MGRPDDPLVLEQPLELRECRGGVALQHVRGAALEADLAAAADAVGWVALVDSSVTATPPDPQGRLLRMPAAAPEGAPEGDRPALALTLSPLPARLVVLELRGAPGARGTVLLGLRPGHHPVRAGEPPLGVDLSGLYVTLPVQLGDGGRLELHLRAPLGRMEPGQGLFAQFATAELVDGRWRLSLGPADGRYFEFVDAPR
jgi:hypothetical protein